MAIVKKISLFLNNYTTYTFLVLFWASLSPRFDGMMLLAAFGLGFVIERTVEFDSHLDKVKKTSWPHRIISLVSLITIVIILIPHLGYLFIVYALVFIWYDIFWSRFFLSKYVIATSYAVLSTVYYPNMILGFSASWAALLVFALADVGYQWFDDICDLEEDQKKERKTFPILFGPHTTRIWITILLAASALLFALATDGTHRWVWLFYIAARVHMSWRDDYRLVVLSFALIAAHSALLALGIELSLF